MFTEIIKAMAVGVAVAVPIGPVLILVVQKTLCNGRRSGLVTSIGSAFADTVFGTVGIFALGLIEDFVNRNQSLIMIIGGAVLAYVGYLMFRKDVRLSLGARSAGTDISYAFQAAGCALSNPGALAFMLAVLARFGLDSGSVSAPIPILLLAIFCGQMLYWLLVTWVISRFLKFKPDTLHKISKVSGILIIILGAAILAEGLFFL